MVWNFSTLLAHAHPQPGWRDAEAQRTQNSMRARLEAAKMALRYPERVERLDNGLGWRIMLPADSIHLPSQPMEQHAGSRAP